MEIISRSAAKAIGAKYYFTGKPCLRGHISKRRVGKKDCVECRNTTFRLKDKQSGKKAGWDRSYIKNNPTKRGEKRKRQRLYKSVPTWYGELDDLVVQEATSLCMQREYETKLVWHVDHMLPLRAKNVSGLHCADNLQVIPAKMNLAKGNKLMYTERYAWLK